MVRETQPSGDGHDGLIQRDTDRELDAQRVELLTQRHVRADAAAESPLEKFARVWSGDASA